MSFLRALSQPLQTYMDVDTLYSGNPLWLWVAVFVGTFSGYLLLRALRRAVNSLCTSTKVPTEWQKPLKDVLGRTRSYFLFALAAYIAVQFLELKPKTDLVCSNVFKFVLFLQAAFWLDRALKIGVRHAVVGKSKDRSLDQELNSPRTVIVTFMARVLILLTVLLVFLDNLGVNISALVTGLGIGGVAVALAVQNVLGDLFASLAIALDKPFEVGDVICISPHTGTVEKVGLKTTRIRLNTGEQLIVGNQEILRNRIQNFKRQQERRVSLGLSVSSAHPAQRIQQLLNEVRDMIAGQPKVRCERAWAKGFEGSHLQLEWVYVIGSPEFSIYTETQTKLSLHVIEICARLQITVVESEKEGST